MHFDVVEPGNIRPDCWNLVVWGRRISGPAGTWGSAGRSTCRSIGEGANAGEYRRSSCERGHGRTDQKGESDANAGAATSRDDIVWRDYGCERQLHHEQHPAGNISIVGGKDRLRSWQLWSTRSNATGQFADRLRRAGIETSVVSPGSRTP